MNIANRVVYMMCWLLLVVGSTVLLQAQSVTMMPGQRQYREAKSVPDLSVSAVQIPDDKSKPLEIALVFRRVGRNPVALSQEQFSVSIFNKDEKEVFFGKPIFPSDVPKVFTLARKKSITLRFGVLENHLDQKKYWNALPSGNYILRVYINSSKMRNFDYQWLG